MSDDPPADSGHEPIGVTDPPAYSGPEPIGVTDPPAYSGPEPIGPDEAEAFDAAARKAFHEPVRAEDVAYDALAFEPERTLAIRHDGEIVATAMALTRRLTVPGGALVPA